jgi:hypothetical protein
VNIDYDEEIRRKARTLKDQKYRDLLKACMDAAEKPDEVGLLDLTFKKCAIMHLKIDERFPAQAERESYIVTISKGPIKMEFWASEMEAPERRDD